MRSFVLATANAHKLEEVKAILAEFQIDLKSLFDFLPLKFPEETGTTYEENALRKARFAAKTLKQPVLADDSGLEIEMLPGQLGIRSSRFLGAETSYRVKNEKVLELLLNVPVAQRKAKFVCAAAAVLPDGRSWVAQGEINGEIAFEPMGNKGFGYDPIFFLPDLKTTMADLSAEEKNKISHRAKAFRKLWKEVTRGDGR